jgi:hypothetical protein
VTHQGSESIDQHGLLLVNSTKVEQPADLNRKPTLLERVHCPFCGGSCSAFVRYRFLGRSRVPKTVHSDRRGTKHDYSP